MDFEVEGKKENAMGDRVEKYTEQPNTYSELWYVE